MSNDTRRCWLFHKWTKWEEVKVPGILMPSQGRPALEYVAIKQQRVCERCGKIQREEI